VFALATAVEERLAVFEAPMRVAVMGCIVNGPGEAREADVGVASGKGKGQIFRHGQVIRTVPEGEIVDALMHEAKLLAEEYRMAGGRPGTPEVVRT
jgi:(E)-4-hydroxy-3-methylbut-2-enyl-diphosphate synthase